MKTITSACRGCFKPMEYILLHEDGGTPQVIPPNGVVAYRDGHLCSACEAVVHATLIARSARERNAEVGFDPIAKAIYNDVIDSLQAAEEIGGPEAEDYIHLMTQLAEECQRRADVYQCMTAGDE
jgi:hypothetical protein